VTLWAKPARLAGAPPRIADVTQQQLDRPDIASVLVSQQDIARRLQEVAAEIARDYAGRELVLVGVLKGAVMVMADLARALELPLARAPRLRASSASSRTSTATSAAATC
jgi:hypoxanthine-guanine phosphoribosyltransferase